MESAMSGLSSTLVFLLVAGMALQGCGEGTAPADPADLSVDVNDSNFNPATGNVTLTDGTATVRWTWRGSEFHNVTWEPAGPANSPTQASGTFDRTFTTAGTFTYYCTLHGGPGTGMHGTIVVQN